MCGETRLFLQSGSAAVHPTKLFMITKEDTYQ